MNAKKHFEKHFAKLNLEAVIFSATWGLIVGTICGFIAALITWITAVKPVWLSILIPLGTVALVCLGVGVALYIFKYRPTPKKSAKRLDSLGLHERMITMLELEQEDSFIARLQREDAKTHLSKVPTSSIKIVLSTTMIILLSVFLTLSTGMTTVAALAAADIIPSGFDTITDTIEEIEPDVYFSVTYEVEDGGYIDGEAEQLVIEGGNAEPVTAVAEEGFVFVEWDDGRTKPGRQDNKITSDVIYYAIFEPIADEGEDGDPSEDAPTDSPKESEEGEQSKPGEDPSDSSGGPGGKYDEINQVINNNTYYRDVLKNYRDLLEERLANEGDTLSDEERAIIEKYLEIL